jgi:signal transduction histidine kinase
MKASVFSAPAGVKRRLRRVARRDRGGLDFIGEILNDGLVPFDLDNSDRLRALLDYAILDSPREEEFDQLVRLAGEVFHVSKAAISFVEKDRQWFKAEVGLGLQETPVSCSVCAHAIESGLDLLVIPDATADARTSCNPFVTGAPNIRFYAGAVLRTPEGHGLGALLLLDTEERRLSPVEERLLVTLARQVMLMLESRRVSEKRLSNATRLSDEAERRKEMLGVVSHDLRQPLATISMVAHLSEEWGGTDAPGHRLAELGGLLRESAEDMRRLVADLSDYSMGEQGQLVMRFQETSGAALARAIRKRHRLVARAAGTEFEVASDGELPEILRADPYRIFQAVGNLIGNALHQTARGGRIDVRFSATGDGGLAIEVTDNGKGIPAESIGKIFDKFWTSGGLSGGRGIGLAVARGIARSHGGDITVTSEPGVRTTFRLTIGRVPAES